MQHINLHGPLSTLYLHELTKGEKYQDYNSTQKAARELWQGGYVYRPVQQAKTIDVDANYLVYDLTEKGWDYLKDQGLYVNALRPAGHWVHAYMTACITASAEYACKENGWTYIPPHEVLEDNSLGHEISFKWNQKKVSKKLIPDSIFAIDYGGKFTAFILEADRNNEGNQPKSHNRKSDLRNILQYRSLFEEVGIQNAYGLKCPTFVINVTVSAAHRENVLALIEKEMGKCKYLTYGLAPMFGDLFKPPGEMLSHLFEEPLKRAGCADFCIKK